MCGRRIEFGQVQVLCPLIERLRILLKEFNVEDSFWSRQVILLQVVIEASTRRSEVGNTGGNGDTRSSHHQNILILSFSETFHEVIVIVLTGLLNFLLNI